MKNYNVSEEPVTEVAALVSVDLIADDLEKEKPAS